jgi:hypothetical protein
MTNHPKVIDLATARNERRHKAAQRKFAELFLEMGPSVSARFMEEFEALVEAKRAKGEHIITPEEWDALFDRLGE